MERVNDGGWVLAWAAGVSRQELIFWRVKARFAIDGSRKRKRMPGRLECSSAHYALEIDLAQLETELSIRLQNEPKRDNPCHSRARCHLKDAKITFFGAAYPFTFSKHRGAQHSSSAPSMAMASHFYSNSVGTIGKLESKLLRQALLAPSHDFSRHRLGNWLSITIGP